MRKFNVKVNGIAYEVEIEEIQGGAVQSAPVAAPAPVAAAPAAVKAATQSPAPAKAAAPVAGGETVKAPMPGTILDVKQAVGAKVAKGDVLVILEAMKMENEIVAPKEGTVAQILVQKGASVNSGDVMVVLQ